MVFSWEFSRKDSRMRLTLALNLSPEYTNTFTALTDTLSATFHQGGGVSTAGQKANVWGLSCWLHTAMHQCEHSYTHARSQSQTCSVELSRSKILLLSTAKQELKHSSALLFHFYFLREKDERTKIQINK